MICLKVSKKANSLTDPIALSSIRLVAQHLLTAYKEPDNKAAREAMMLAACQGGMAFANSSVCLVHGMGRPIGALYHVPHGLSNAVLRPVVTEYSLSGAPEQYAAIARTMSYVMLALIYIGTLLLIIPRQYRMRHLMGTILLVFFTVIVVVIYVNFIPSMSAMAEDLEEQEEKGIELSGGLQPTTETVDHYGNLLISVLIINVGLMAVLGGLFATSRRRDRIRIPESGPEEQ